MVALLSTGALGTPVCTSCTHATSWLLPASQLGRGSKFSITRLLRHCSTSTVLLTPSTPPVRGRPWQEKFFRRIEGLEGRDWKNMTVPMMSNFKTKDGQWIIFLAVTAPRMFKYLSDFGIKGEGIRKALGSFFSAWWK